MTGIRSLAPLVQSLAIEPAGRKRVASVLACMHDKRGGEFSATMDQIAAAAALSKVQARKHVHALIAEGLIAVVGNAFGGAPGAGPSYAFNAGLLEQLAACSPDLFWGQDQVHGDRFDQAYRFAVDGTQFVACLIGEPGARRVVFWRVDGVCANYGDVPLKVLLLDLRVRGSWHCHLLPNGNPDVPLEQMYHLTFDDVALLANWAQNAALGRVESLVAA